MRRYLIAAFLIAGLGWAFFNVSHQQDRTLAESSDPLPQDEHATGNSQLEQLDSAEDSNHAKTDSPDTGERTFAQLLESADSGDPTAALEVAEAIWKCRYVPESRARYENELAAGKSESEEMIQKTIENISWCSDKPRDTALTEQYLRLAADAGLPEAMVRYAVIAPVILSSASQSLPLTAEGRAELLALDTLMLDYLTRAAEAGYPKAASFLGYAHTLNIGEGFMNPGDPLIRTADPAEAYAWYYAYAIVDQSPSARQRFERMEPNLRNSQELESARARGQALYAQYFAEPQSEY